jgi:hypothetical protein
MNEVDINCPECGMKLAGDGVVCPQCLAMLQLWSPWAWLASSGGPFFGMMRVIVLRRKRDDISDREVS